MSLIGFQPKRLSITQAAADKTETHGIVSADKKTLTIRPKAVRLVVHSGPAKHKLRFTAQKPPFKGTFKSVGMSGLPHGTLLVRRTQGLERKDHEAVS